MNKYLFKTNSFGNQFNNPGMAQSKFYIDVGPGYNASSQFPLSNHPPIPPSYNPSYLTANPLSYSSAPSYNAPPPYPNAPPYQNISPYPTPPPSCPPAPQNYPPAPQNYPPAPPNYPLPPQNYPYPNYTPYPDLNQGYKY